jgi:CHAT domain-containing protein
MYILSYTTTLSTLITAREGMAREPAVPKVLVVGQPDDYLPQVEEELRRIQKFGNFVTVLSGERASYNTVLTGLKQHSWTHFACHGFQDIQPFKSSFILHNDYLSLLDLIHAQLPNAEFAFLSACETAAVGVDGTPDEVINLGAALQFCGFRSAIATQWEIWDVDGPNISQSFYSHMFRRPGNKADFRDSAEALNMATQKMRRSGVGADRWISFVHIGA